MDINSPLFTMMWSMVMLGVTGAATTVHNYKTAQKLIALFQHGIHVLQAAIDELSNISQ